MYRALLRLDSLLEVVVYKVIAFVDTQTFAMNSFAQRIPWHLAQCFRKPLSLSERYFTSNLADSRAGHGHALVQSKYLHEASPI